jgi:hypothetical protein
MGIFDPLDQKELPSISWTINRKISEMSEEQQDADLTSVIVDTAKTQI